MNDQNRLLWAQQLTAGLSAMSIDASSTQQEQLLNYLTLLLKWNKAYNLTAIRDVSQMVSRQLLDSLSIMPFLSGERILDVGTGAGLPGIPLAVLNPHKDFVLLDTNSKKTRFLRQVVIELGLANVEVEQQRVELFQAPQKFDCITSRAFASLLDMVGGSQHLLAEQGVWLAMKAQSVQDEINALPDIFSVKVDKLSVPNETALRQLAQIRSS